MQNSIRPGVTGEYGKSAEAATSAQFSMPGTYWLRAIGFDTQLEAIHDFKVTVTQPQLKKSRVAASGRIQIKDEAANITPVLSFCSSDRLRSSWNFSDGLWSRRPECRRRSLKWIPCGRSRCRTIGSSARRSASSADAQRSYLDHSSRRARSKPRKQYVTTNPPARRLLRARAARPRVQRGGRSDRALGRPGRRLRLAGFEPRHHRRLQRQCLDRRQRPRRAACRRWPRMKARWARAGAVQRQHGPEVHADRESS